MAKMASLEMMTQLTVLTSYHIHPESPKIHEILIYDMARGEYYKASIQYKYVIYNCRYKTVIRSFYLHNGMSNTGKMAYLCWISTGMLIC